MRLATLTTSLADLLFPPRCAGCGDGLVVEAQATETASVSSVRFCSSCRTDLEAARSLPACPGCAGTVGPFEVSEGQCAECRERPSRTAGTVRGGPYRGLFARLIRQCKYAEREDLLKPLSAWMVDEVGRQSWRSSVEAVTFVPTHWTRRLARPFHAAELLASAISVALSIPRVALLRRTRGGPHQTGLSFTARVENVRGAFAVRHGTQLDGATLLLVDDVRTTGATVEECTRVLLRAGAAKVYAVVAARVDWTPGTPAPIDLI